jgi:putative membrane protein
VFALVWTVLAISPKYRADWLLENGLTFIAVPIAVLTYRRFRFSDRAYVQLTAFLILHTIGSHYTYSEVPLGAWLAQALDLSRNHYDRIVHFAFGLLLLRPVRELVFRGRREWSATATFVLSVACVVSLSVTYELIEWAVAVVVDPAAGTAFLGTQGDPWDAQKDMGLACLGAAIAAWIDVRFWPPVAIAAAPRGKR